MFQLLPSFSKSCNPKSAVFIYLCDVSKNMSLSLREPPRNSTFDRIIHEYMYQFQCATKALFFVQKQKCNKNIRFILYLYEIKTIGPDARYPNRYFQSEYKIVTKCQWIFCFSTKLKNGVRS